MRDENKRKRRSHILVDTDGVNEAMDPDASQYGEDRLLNLLASCAEDTEDTGDNAFCESVCRKVSESEKEEKRQL